MGPRQSLLIYAAILALVAAACTPRVRVNVDSSKQVDFTKYHVYAIRQGNSTGVPELDEQIQCQIETALFDKGWHHIATTAMRTYEAFYRDSIWQWQSGGGRQPVGPIDAGQRRRGEDV